jgi:hypothetical protein
MPSLTLLRGAVQSNAMKHGLADDRAGIGLGSLITLLIKVFLVFLCGVVARFLWTSVIGRITTRWMDSSRNPQRERQK